MSNPKVYADSRAKMAEVGYLWENFRLDLDQFLNKLSLKQPFAEESESVNSFSSIFFKPKDSSGYGFDIRKGPSIDLTLDNESNTPKLGG